MNRHPDSLDLGRAEPMLDDAGKPTGVVTHGRSDGQVWYFDMCTQMPLLSTRPFSAAAARAHFDGWAAWRDRQWVAA